MKKHWLIILAVFIVTAAFASRYEVVAYHEDFENGAQGWTHYDAAVNPNDWHIYNAGGTQGNVWWMGDPALASGANIGGYYDQQYLVLDTPAQTITSANTNLTFKMRYALETPGTSTENPEYNGWDSFNIRVSTDGGLNWVTIMPTSPSYTFTSSFAFGSEHGEGVGIPAWGGSLTTWTQATFNLAAYTGQSVMIRFAFASDPAHATGDELGLFGVMVDDIAFGSYTNNGVADGQMTFASLVPIGGDLWHLAEVAGAPSPSHVFRNQNDLGSYNVNMKNYLVSPPITLPSSGPIWADFMIMGLFDDLDEWPDEDRWGWEITPNDGVSWYPMSNPYGSATGSNYVYTDAPDIWSSAIASYTLTGMISDYAGQTVRFRWYFQSDADAPIGTGIMIDDFKIYNDVQISAPQNLTADVSGSTVTLNWVIPGELPPPPPPDYSDDFESYSDFALTFGDWVTQDVDQSTTFGFESATFPNSGSAMAYIIFNPSMTTPALTSITTHSGAKMPASFAAETPTNNDWLISPAMTVQTGDAVRFWARSHTAQYGLERFKVGVSTGGTSPANFTIISGASHIEAPVNWTQFTYDLSAYGGQSIRVGIQCVSNDAFIFFVDDFEIGASSRFNQEVPVYDVAEYSRRGLVEPTPGSRFGMSSRNDAITSFSIYRDGILIYEEFNPEVSTYSDMNVEIGVHTYHVTAMYGQYESPISNSVSIFVLPALHGESYFDDGTSEEALTVGTNRQVGVRHNFYAGNPVVVNYAKVYVHTVGSQNVILRLWDVNPETGLPGTQLHQVIYPIANIIQGWNFIPIPENNAVPGGDFYLTILETAGSPRYGLDTSNDGHTFSSMGSVWAPYTAGEAMIRAIVYTGSSTENEEVPALQFATSNYPNPFNPETNISYSIPQSGVASVKVYNLKGQQIRTLVNGEVAAGTHTVVWNGTDDKGKAVSSGVYFYRVENAGKVITKKMLLSK